MNTRSIMKAAWTTAREGARRFGGSAKTYFAEALRQAWTSFHQKMIVSKLDDAAQRADTIGRTRATPKQCWYLAGLMARNGCTYVERNLILTKREASRIIDLYAR